MAKTVKERIEYATELLGSIFKAIVTAKAVISLIAHDYDEQEEKMVEHLARASEHVGLVEAELLALAGLIEDGQAIPD